MRNLILFISSLAILGVLFVGYVFLLDDPVLPDDTSPGNRDVLPIGSIQEDAVPLSVGNVGEIQPGGGGEFTLYDEQTGRPTQHFRWQEWTPIDEEGREVRVDHPELTLFLPRGLTARVSAARGQITLERLNRGDAEPKRGILEGGVRIAIERPADDAVANVAEAKRALWMSAEMTDLRFDLEIGRLRTEGPLTVISPEFELAGTGLELLWNAADNRLDSLILERGQRLVLYGNAGLFGPEEPTDDTELTGEPETPPAQDATTSTDADGQSEPPARIATTYTCELTGQVSARQYAGENLFGELTAEQIHLLIDLTSRANRFMEQPTSQAAAESRAPEEPRNRLEVAWTGPLTIGPGDAAASESPRRRFEALGDPVVMTSPDGLLRCGRVEYFDETQQLWLYAASDGRVSFEVGDSITANADSVYVDQAARIIKLIGDVQLISNRGSGNKPPQNIRCHLWAELHLGAGDSAAPDQGNPMKMAGNLERAVFAGEVQIDLPGRTLTADRVDAQFRPGTTTGAETDAAGNLALESAVATGNVRLWRQDEALECAWLNIQFAAGAGGDPIPQHVDARGDVLIARGESWLAGDRVSADFAAFAAKDPAKGGPDFRLVAVEITGAAELRDPKHLVAARADRIRAEFDENNQLRHAALFGNDGNFALAHKSPYTVGGPQIDLDWAEQSMRVAGPARLRFKTQRSLQGRQRSRPTRVEVTCDGALDIDAQRNSVHFIGNVVARSGDEELDAETLTLLLEDIPETETAAAKPASLMDVVTEARNAIAAARLAPAPSDPLDTLAEPASPMRKEPVRLIADRALLKSETFGDDLTRPLVHMSIEAPRLEVDIREREISTIGLTTLLLLNRQVRTDMTPRDAANLGVASALVARGPSQTAMRCQESMTYVIGNDGPDRRDWVLFKGNVQFAHQAGGEKVQVQELLPNSPATAGQDANFKGRFTQLLCDRLECGIAVAPDKTGGAASMSSRSMQFNWLLATGNAYLRDEQGETVRDVQAHQLDFDRTLGLVRVLGTRGAPARIGEENPQTGTPRNIFGEEFVLYLETGTVRAGPTSGEIRE